jgi:hypothetical protein
MIAQLNKEYISAKPTKAYSRLLSYFFYEGRPATTKGRWFNPVTFLSLRSASKAKHVAGAENPIFITGTGRSGSTMLGLVMSMHKHVGFLNEPKALWYHVNPADDLIGSYCNGNANYIMNGANVNSEIADSVKSIYSSFLKYSGSTRIIDKFPEMIFRIDYLNKIFADPKYIFLYRNAMETIASTAMWSNTHRDTEKNEDWWGVNNRKWKLLVEQVVPFDEYLAQHQATIADFNCQTDKAAVEWIVTMNQGLKMSIAYPDKVLPLNYEMLCSDNQAALRKICNFTGLEHDANCFDFGKQVIRESKVLNHIKLHPILEGPIKQLSKQLGYSTHSPSMIVTE